MRLKADGDGYRLSATVHDGWQLRWWLLSHPGKMIIREPLALRQELRHQLEPGLQIYRDDILSPGAEKAQTAES